MKRVLNSRFSSLIFFLSTTLILFFLVRIFLFINVYHLVDLNFITFLKVFGVGFLFDCTVVLSFSILYILYLIFIPRKIIGSKFDKFFTYFLLISLLFIVLFACFGEIPFWYEFNTRYNFIAVDYLIYTYEVVENINQSYPIPLILLILISCIFLILYIFKRRKIGHFTFQSKINFSKRALLLFPLLCLNFVSLYFLENNFAEFSSNAYENELSKNGVFSFFAAFISNELDYEKFYSKIPEKEAFRIIKKELQQENSRYNNSDFDAIERTIEGTGIQNPNIILVCIESFSAEYSSHFGNSLKLTPNFDSLAAESIFFKNMYATGTRTVRGMEALTLCVPPTPGNSIVRRPENDNLQSIATILKQKKYNLNFIYGGDGYFDNMNTFFGGQGFDIIDRDRGNPLSDNIKTNRTSIPDSEVTFENAWGICDEDIYFQSLKNASKLAKNGQPFFQFIMTTSNHKPYSFPKKKINAPQGERESAVKYTDFALGKFIDEAKTKDWFSNTIFIIVADHCASSAGKWEINIEKHHIPALIYNFKGKNEICNKLVSQIDLTPTLFGLLNWNFSSGLYGKDIFKMNKSEERALIGNYRTLGLLKSNIFTEINDRKKINQYNWNIEKKEMFRLNKEIDSLKKLTISYYQTASLRFKNKKMKAN